MEDDLDRLHHAFGDDTTLDRLIGTLRPIVQSLPDEDDDAFVRALSELRAYLTETYKLHRRILRNRRKSFPWATPRRSGLDTVTYACPGTCERYQALDELRVHLFNIEAVAEAHADLFAAAVHPTAAPPLYNTLRSHGIGESRALELARRVDSLAMDVRVASVRVTTLVDTVVQILRAGDQQIVVFCDQPSDADHISSALKRVLPAHAVQRHRCALIDDRSSDGLDESWRDFLLDPGRCRVLVCDVRAEEGLNLHGGRKVAIHFDLPPTPNRLEQRLGRLDRFGSGDAIKSVAIVCVDDENETAWLECLNEGLQVFTTSMASLQYLVEESMRVTSSNWAGEGAQSLLNWRDQLAGPTDWVIRERRRIDQQDALDAMGEPQAEVYEALEAVDDDWAAWQQAFDGFAVHALQLQKRFESWPGAQRHQDQVFRLCYRRDGGRQTLFSLNAFVSEFLGTIDTEAKHSTPDSPLTFAYAFRRNTALSKQGRALGVRPLRYGDALVESLSAFCESDDRGRVFAMWRHLPGYQPRDASGIDLYFRFDFLMEADISLGADMSENEDESRALRRRADGHFPPKFYTVWVDMSGSASVEAPLQLREPYRRDEQESGSGRDYNLNPRRWQILQMQSDIPWIMQWSQHCADACVGARGLLATLDAVRASIKQGTRGLQARHDTRAAQLSARVFRLEGAARAAEQSDLGAESRVHERLMAAVRSPAFLMDVAGAVFVSPSTPFE